MKMIIEAHWVDDGGQTERVQLASINRDLTTDPLGLGLAEGKALLAATQKYFVEQQCESIAFAHAYCERCEAKLSLKGRHERQIRTVFGTVQVQSPRVRYCRCSGKAAGASFSPLIQLVPTCMTPELEYLQVKWAAHLPYAAATRLLCEILPVSDAISVSSTKRRVRAVGATLDQSFGQPANTANEQLASGVPPALTALAVDSGWLKHCNPPRRQGRHVNLVVGRACFEGGNTRLYAYVHNQVPSAAARLDQFLSASGVRSDERVTVVTDGAGEFQKAVNGASWPVCRIMDWFHIAMKFRAIEQTARKYPGMVAPNGRGLNEEGASCKWLVWHGKVAKAVMRLKSIHDALEEIPVLQDSALYWNLRHAWWYLRSNDRYLVNYGRRHHKGLPISSAIAESAVNEVVSLRMAKKRQMRWTDEGAHLLAQVRVHELNGELRPRVVPFPWRTSKPPPSAPWDGYQMLMAA